MASVKSQRVRLIRRHDNQTERPRMFGVRRKPRRRLSLRLLMVFEGRSRHDHQALRPRMFGVRREPRRRLSLRLLMAFEGRSRHDHQGLRPRMSGVRRGPRKRLSVRLLMVFETGSDLEASCRKARSPGLTSTHVWRLERFKWVRPAMKRLIFHWI